MDLLCWDDVDEFGREIEDDPVQEAAQDLHHHLIEVYGSNPDQIDRGVSIGDRLSGTDTPDEIQRAIEDDFRKDDRVKDVVALIQDDPSDPNGYLIDIKVELTEGTISLAYSYDANGNLVRKAGA